MQLNKFTYSGLILAGAIFFFAQSALGEHNYIIAIIRLEKAKFDSQWIIPNFKVNKVNSTCTTVNGKIELKKDWPTDDTVQCSMIASNSIGGGQYKRSLIGFGPTPCCEFIETDKLFYPSLPAAGTLPTKCPLKKAIFEIKEWNVNKAELVDTLPQPNDWKVEVVITIKKKEVLKITGYGKIIRTIGL